MSRNSYFKKLIASALLKLSVFSLLKLAVCHHRKFEVPTGFIKLEILDELAPVKTNERSLFNCNMQRQQMTVSIKVYWPE